MFKKYLHILTFLVMFLGVTSQASAALSATNVAIKPKNFSIEVDNDFNRAVLYWNWYNESSTSNEVYRTDDGYVKADYFRLYRKKDGGDWEVIQENGANYKCILSKYIDRDLEEGTYVYRIRAHFPKQLDMTGAQWGPYSDELTVVIDPLNDAKVLWSVKEIYNYPIGTGKAASNTSGDNFIPGNLYGVNSKGTRSLRLENFDNRDSWRDGGFRRISNDGPVNADGNYEKPVISRGYWYVFDKEKGRIMRTIAGMYASTTGLKTRKFNDAGERLYLEDKDNWKVCTYVPVKDQAIGFGVDCAGNIIVRTGNYFYGSIQKIVVIPWDNYATSSNAQAKQKMDDGEWPVFDLTDKTTLGTGSKAVAESDIDKTWGGTTQPGRTDYFSVWGNILNNGPTTTTRKKYVGDFADAKNTFPMLANSEFPWFINGTSGAKRLQPDYANCAFIPHASNYVYQIKFTDGKKDANGKYTVTATLSKTKLVGKSFDYQIGGKPTVSTPNPGTENYSFFVDEMPDRIIAQIRSSGFYRVRNIDGVNGALDVKTVIARDGEVNQAGGATLYFKGKHATGIYCNNLFMVSSLSRFSECAGAFQVIRGKPNRNVAYGDMTIEDFDLYDKMPVAFYIQNESNLSGAAANANSNFLYMEKLLQDDGWHLYIHQYIPATRIAMYELIPDISFKNTKITVTSALEYEVHGETGLNADIKGVECFASWAATDFDPEGDGDYKVRDYSVVVTSPSGDKSWELTASAFVSYHEGDTENAFVPIHVVVKDKDGNVIDEYDVDMDVPAENKYTTLEYGEYCTYYNVPLKGADELSYTEKVGGKDVQRNYKAQVVTKFFPKVNPDDPIKSSPKLNESKVTYEPVEPYVTAQLWKGEEGSAVEGKYRVDLQFTHDTPINNPDEKVGLEPASHYELLIQKNENEEPHKMYITYGKTVTENPNWDGTDCCNRFIITDNKEEEASFYHLSEVKPTEVKLDCTTVCSFDNAEALQDHINDNHGQTTKIPGTTDLSESSRQYATRDAGTEEEIAKGAQPSNITFYPKVEEGENPENWKFFIQPVYAASVPSLTKTSIGEARVTGGGTTSVGLIGDDKANGGLEINPNPAVSDVTVSVEEPLKSVVVYNNAGIAVKSFYFAGENTAEKINVGSLVPGTYHLHVNNNYTTTLIRK